MTTATSVPPPTASAPSGGGLSDKEVGAAGGVLFLGAAMAGPLGFVCAALAIGIERAFLKTGRDQPAWLGGPAAAKLTPEELEQRRQEALRLAREFLEDARDRAQARRAAHADHRKAVRDYIKNGRQGDKPVWTDGRDLGEFMGDLYNASKSWCRLFDDRLGQEFDKFNDAPQRVGEFFKNLWDWCTDFFDDVKDYRDDARNQRLNRERQATEAEWGTAPDPQPAPARPVTDQARRPLTEPTSDPDGDPQQPPIVVPPAQTPLTTDPTAPAMPGTTRPTTPLGAGIHTEQSQSVQGEIMNPDGSVALPAGGGSLPASSARQGTTNLDLLYQAFQPIAPLLVSVGAQAADLAAMHAVVTGRLAQIAALCAYKGAPAAVHQSLDRGRQTANALAAGIALVDRHNAIARELTEEALIGLMPAQQDQNQVHSEGASGDLFGAVQNSGE